MAKNLKANFVFWVVLMMIIFLEGISGLTGKNSENQGKKEIIVLPGTSSSVLPFSSAVKAGNFMFLSGVIGTDLKTNDLVSPDAGEQTRQCLEKLKLVLAQGGMDMGDVVNATVYLSDVNDYEAMNKVYSTYFPSDPPARACVQVGKLVKGAKVEIAMVAWKVK